MDDAIWTVDQEQRARDRGVDARFGRNVLLGAFLNEGIDLLLANHLYLPRKIVVDPEPFEGQEAPPDRLFGGFNPVDETIYINPRSSFFGFAPESAIRIAGAHFGEGLWSTDSPHHVLLHELGHELCYRQDPTRYAAMRNAPLPDEAMLVALDLTSARATRDVLEFVAEVFAALALGEYVHEDVLEWYQIFGGSMP